MANNKFVHNELYFCTFNKIQKRQISLQTKQFQMIRTLNFTISIKKFCFPQLKNLFEVKNQTISEPLLITQYDTLDVTTTLHQ